MKLRNDQQGFTFVEILITIAVLGIVAGASISMFGHIKSTNVEKAMQIFADEFSKAQIKTMTREKPTNLYLCRSSGVLYCYATEDEYDSVTVDAIKANGIVLGNNNIIVRFYNGYSETEEPRITMTDDCPVEIKFHKSGKMRDTLVKAASAGSSDRIVFHYPTYRLEFHVKNGVGRRFYFSTVSYKYFIEPADYESAPAPADPAAAP